MARFAYHLFPYLSDNYGVLIHDPESGATAAIDAGDGGAVLAALEEKGWNLTDLWITHHHADHTDGVSLVKEKTGCTVTGPKGKSSAIAGIDREVGEGDTFGFAGAEVRVIETPGHTLDMINFHLPSEGVVFTGDTLFTLGCGRVFEGDFAMMWDSLSKLMKLPADTVIYSSHEYTLANAKFALSVDPDNPALKARAAKFEAMRADGKPTVPSTLAEELATNPFLRAADSGIRAHLGMEGESDAAVFAEIRSRKDNF